MARLLLLCYQVFVACDISDAGKSCSWDERQNVDVAAAEWTAEQGESRVQGKQAIAL